MCETIVQRGSCTQVNNTFDSPFSRSDCSAALTCWSTKGTKLKQNMLIRKDTKIRIREIS